MPGSGSLDTDVFSARLDAHLARVTRRRGPLGAPHVAVRSPRLGLDYRFGDQDRRFHIASIGKMFTATLVMQLVEAGAFTVDTRVAALLPGAELAGLFAADSVPGGAPDVAAGATVHHLLTHTAGVADYFESPVTSGRTLRQQVVDEPDTVWTPADLLSHSRRNQRPVGRPGERFLYSDTGFILLGRIVEEATGAAFHDALRDRLFAAAGMTDSAVLFHSPEARDAASVDLAPLWLDGVELSRARSLSCDWAGGGMASTLDDLLAFSKALHSGELITLQSVGYLCEARHRIRPGIHYGAGMMQMRFEGLMPLLRGLPRLAGHIGVLSTHLFHDPVHDADIVLNFASSREMRRSVRTLVAIERLLLKADA